MGNAPRKKESISTSGQGNAESIFPMGKFPHGEGRRRGHDEYVSEIGIQHGG
jgi:hypothetical protein